ncbi:MAG: sodium:solute symporter family protein [Maribacter sp.]
MLAVFIGIYIALTLAIGFWASKRIKTTNDFTLAGKSLPMTLVGVTIFATWFGAEMIMGVPGQFVERGIMGIITDQFGNVLCLTLVAFFYARRLYEMNIVTLGDFFKIRYNKSLELATSLIIVTTYFFWIAAQFVALAYLFESVLGTSISNGILIGASIVVVYTYIGGMWAVTLTDLFQSILIVLGLLIVLVIILGKTGGVAPLFADKPDTFFHFFPEYGFYNWTDYLAMWMAFGLGAIPAQEIYQRLFSAKSAKAGVRGVMLSALLLFTITTIPLIIGLGAAYLHPELMGNDQGQNLIPSMVSQYAGLPVQLLFFGALISAILSTSSGAMLSPATIIGENLLKPYMPDISDKHLLFYTRISVVLVAFICCVLAFNDSNIHGLVVASTVLLMVCLFAPLTFGLFWKKASVFGAWISIFTGGLVWFFCDYHATRVDPTIYGTISSCLGLVVGSYVRPDGGEKK